MERARRIRGGIYPIVTHHRANKAAYSKIATSTPNDLCIFKQLHVIKQESDCIVSLSKNAFREESHHQTLQHTTQKHTTQKQQHTFAIQRTGLQLRPEHVSHNRLVAARSQDFCRDTQHD